MFKKQAQNQIRKVSHRDSSQRTTQYSYYANRGKNLDKKNREKPSTEQSLRDVKSLFWNHVITIILLIVILAAGSDFLFLNANPKIIELKSSFDSTVLLRNANVYQQEAESFLKSSILNRNKLTINIGGITSDLQNKFPELTNVSVTLPLSGHQVTIYIEPAKPVVFLNTVSYGGYLLDSNGTVIGAVNSKNQKVVAGLDLPIIQYAGYQAQLDRQALSSSDVSFAVYVFDELKVQHINVQPMILQAANRELDVYLSGTSYYVKFNLEAPSNEQVGALIDIREYMQQHNITPSQYIDVRIVGRAYYK